jgi:four helix bundle protein
MNKEGKIKRFADLYAWQEAHKLAVDLYKTTEFFPEKEKFGLISQLRRAGVSVSSNIAEGFGRATYGEKINFYSMASGSLSEIQSQLLISRDVGFLPEVDFLRLAQRTVVAHKLISCLIKKSRIIQNS